eukprot:352775-Chlamydomonas_euryale.AAC.6
MARPCCGRGEGRGWDASFLASAGSVAIRGLKISSGPKPKPVRVHLKYNRQAKFSSSSRAQ